ncbi:MAG: NAD(P)/FAD-dependent oxidoreductase [Woeseiaceae bacterium]
MKTRDVVIVGAGIIGMSIAWQLSLRSKLKVSVLEKGGGVGEGSTGASSAVCRYRYGTDEMVRFARDGIAAFHDWRSFTRLDEPRAEFQHTGVLWLPGSDTEWADREHLRMQRLGVSTEVLDDVSLKERFPSLSTCIVPPDVETGEEHECHGGGRHFFETDGGYIDPVSTTQDLVEACCGAGVDVRFHARVTGIETEGGRVTSVALESGESIATPLVINAAGPWFRDLNKAVGLEFNWDIKPIRVQVLHRDRPEELGGNIPTTADIEGGIYFRTENRGAQLVVSSVLNEDHQEVISDPDSFAKYTDQDFELRKMHALHHRFPDLTYHGKIRGYCGLYTLNRDDLHPVLGETGIGGYWVANGFSGHGFKHAPAVGSMLAQAITGERGDFDTDVQMSTFSINRKPIQPDPLTVAA